MAAKPDFYATVHGEAFIDADVAATYHMRPPYPDEVFKLLAELLGDQPRVVLDLGCGAGAIARRVAPLVDRVDAVDISAPMIEEGKRLPGGDHPALRWIVGRAEDAPLDPPYGMVTAAASLHWMDWDVVLPRIGRLLTPGGYLVRIEDGWALPPWQDELVAIIVRYTVNPTNQPFFDLPAELVRRNLFALHGRRKTAPVPFQQSLESYIESFHARSSLTRARLGPDAARAFDAEVRELLLRHQRETVDLQLIADVAWGRPTLSP
jgi:SAM-dependent methyltransferase